MYIYIFHTAYIILELLPYKVHKFQALHISKIYFMEAYSLKAKYSNP